MEIGVTVGFYRLICSGHPGWHPML